MRRVWRSRKALKGVTQWVIDWGVPMAVGAGLLYFYAARSASPSRVYKTFALIDPPHGALLWTASLIGWLLVPAIIGGFAGHVIATRISSAKSISTETLFRQRKLGQRIRPPGLIDDLRRYFHGPVAQQYFVDMWVRVAHRNDWDRAQDHWEVFIRDMVSTQQYAHLDRHECLRQAQGTARLALAVTARVGQCIVCERRR
ncbi:hypothetical protein BEK98_34815 [Streptomyces diastatochromogenes]|uniref:Uncharacterized protein n=1 Tax=Streptomyces diastatochromogenes TaxID=42236 RepID=A0A233S3R3_STRDA|nr:hypothetical protein BEK98_34815 [Streptomyces diastatochromogenes]